MADNYYTQTDYMRGGSYAVQRIMMDKCLKPEVQEKIPGIGWVPDKRLRDYNCPLGLETCEEVSGHCKFLTKESCLNQSGDFKDNGMGDKPYLEWHEGKDGERGKCVLGNFPLRNWCENPHSRRAGQFVPGVTNVPPFKYDQDTGRCLMTKPYCEYMGVGFTDRNDDYYKETGIDVPDCHEAGFQKFMEKYVTGKTLFRGMKRGLFNKFLADIGKDIGKGMITPFGAPLTYYKFLKKISDGQYSDELGLNKDYSDVKEDFENPEKLLEEFKTELRNHIMSEMKNQFSNYKKESQIKKHPKSVEGVCDEKLMESSNIVGPNFAGEGVHLRSIIWKPTDHYNGKKSSVVSYGFLSNELKKKWPHLIVNSGGKKILRIDPEMIRNDRNLKRVYMTYIDPEWFAIFISNMLVKAKVVDITLKESFKKTQN